MRALFRTRAATLALLLNVCVILGLLFGAVAFAGAANEPSAQAVAYAAAARSGYEKNIPLRPLVAFKSAPVKEKPAPEPVAKLQSTPGALNCLSAAVYYEARGESAEGRAAVAQVVLNRTRRAEYPHSVCGVVYQGAAQGSCQFSFVCNGAMRGAREHNAWLDARRVAARALAGHVMTAVGNATGFHVVHEASDSAQGAVGKHGVRLGSHLFYAS